MTGCLKHIPGDSGIGSVDVRMPAPFDMPWAVKRLMCVQTSGVIDPCPLGQFANVVQESGESNACRGIGLVHDLGGHWGQRSICRSSGSNNGGKLAVGRC